MTDRARLETTGERPALRVERRLAHSPERVWRAITEPAELARWFPASVAVDLRPGGAIKFTFEGEEAPTLGEVLEADEPRVFAFTWNDDVLRWEITPEKDGSRLLFTHTFGRGEPAIARVAAGRTAAGWDSCLGALTALLDGEEYEQPKDWVGPIEAYIEEFGLADGEVLETADGKVIRFRHDLIWKPLDEVWALLTPERAAIGSGTVTREEPPRVLEFSLPDGGIVRWEFSHSELEGTMVELTRTVPSGLDEVVPEALRKWRKRLKEFFAAAHGA
ncbi:SRPBCC family protein [Amycolatopsis pittospori]|uniref:SRPBCC family protein n=1 Tax=Amycolatopsis pittospori TaxID=2749434 RepID=UPI0015EFEB89|nr:SRPBCC family protein [Amycolatopsis pittospori]